MVENVEYVKVKDIISERNTVDAAHALVNKIENLNAQTIKIDWKDTGSISIAFVDTYVTNLSHTNKKIINIHPDGIDNFVNLIEDKLNPNEKKLFFYYE